MQTEFPKRDAAFSETVDAIFPRLVEIRRDIHRHPELSNREERTSRLVAERLRALGLDVTTGIAHHGVVGLLHGENPGPTIAYRADMDALPIQEIRETPYKSTVPGVMHACGHDVHTTIGLGVAEVLSKHRDELRGTLKFIFQPAEEGAPAGERGGAELMIAQGVLENPAPEAIFGLHVVPAMEVGKIGFTAGPSMAGAARFEITIHGKKSHGAYPHTGIDAVVVASTAVLQLQTISSRMTDPQEPVVVTVGSIHGGNRSNILADEVRLIGTVRALNPDVLNRVEELMRLILSGVTESFGAAFELEYRILVPPVVNDVELVHRVAPTLKRVLGESNAGRWPPRMGAEDFARFAERLPSVFLSLGVANSARNITAPIHTPEFDVDETCIAVGVKAMAAILADLSAAADETCQYRPR